MALILVLAGFAAILVASCILRGWVLSYLWAWFIVPLGVHPISVSWAIGLATVFALLNGTKTTAKTDDDASAALAKAFGAMLVFPLMGLVIGWIVHTIMVG